MNRSDAHSDHRIIFEVLFLVLNHLGIHQLKKYLCMSAFQETEFAPALIEKVFIPNYFVDITDYIDEKLEIMKVYDSELSDPPFPRSIENIKSLALFRGSSVGVKYAESFHLLKYIDK